MQSAVPLVVMIGIKGGVAMSTGHNSLYRYAFSSNATFHVLHTLSSGIMISFLP